MILLTSLVFIFSSASFAEYRVFLLKFEKKSIQPGVPPQVRFLESTLDPEQYPRYFTVSKDETISYQDTWRCFGRTDNMKPFCPNPKSSPIISNGAPDLSRTPASTSSQTDKVK